MLRRARTGNQLDTIENSLYCLTLFFRLFNNFPDYLINGHQGSSFIGDHKTPPYYKSNHVSSAFWLLACLGYQRKHREDKNSDPRYQCQIRHLQKFRPGQIHHIEAQHRVKTANHCHHLRFTCLPSAKIPEHKPSPDQYPHHHTPWDPNCCIQHTLPPFIAMVI